MQGIYRAIAKAGVSQRRFAGEAGIDVVVLNKAATGRINLTPADFKKVCARSGLRPEDVATVQDVDYGVIPIPSTIRRKEPEKRKNPYRLQCRVDAEIDIAFRRLAARRNVTINELLHRLIVKEVKKEQRQGRGKFADA